MVEQKQPLSALITKHSSNLLFGALLLYWMIGLLYCAVVLFRGLVIQPAVPLLDRQVMIAHTRAALDKGKKVEICQGRECFRAQRVEFVGLRISS